MMSRALLLDVDGVVFRHPATLKKVATKVVKYVSHRLSVPDLRQAESINTVMYQYFGHTFTGMKTLYDVDDTPAGFTRFVYDQDMIASLVACPTSDGDLAKASVDLKYVVRSCHKRGIDVYLFSNAPGIWCSTVLSKMRLDTIIPPDNILSCDHDVFEGGLKPDKLVYDNIWNYIAYKDRDQDLQLHFVDDTLVNLMPVLGDSRWRPIWFRRADADPINMRGCRKLTTIDNLYQLTSLI